MLFIADSPVSMTEWTKAHRKDVENVYAQKISKKDVEIISQSMEEAASQQHTAETRKQPCVPPQVKGGRIRRHSSYEPNLDDILEEESDEKGEHSRDLADIHRERAQNSGVMKRDRRGRTWRKQQYIHMNNNYTRPRAYTA